MTDGNLTPPGHSPDGNGASPSPGGGVPQGAKILPLAVGRAAPARETRGALREAVLQVIHHLVIEAVPEDQRSLYFDQAQGLLDEAGWGLDELVSAAADGEARDELFRVLGLT
jgi:hypothetical protein